MKKALSFALAAAMMFSLAACGSKGTPSGSGSSSTGSTSAGGDKKSYSISVGFTTSPSEYDPYNVTCEKFKEYVEEATDGRIQVEIYPGGQLGSETEMFESMQAGTLDMGIVTNAYVAAFVPSNGVFDLPFVFSDLDQARSVIDGDFGTKILDAMQGSGVTGLGWSEGGFRQMATRKAIASPADLAGTKIRCMETKTYLAAYASLGVNATPMAWGETITSLQQGAIDGMDAPLCVLYANGFADVAAYCDLVNLFYSPLVICMSDATLNQFDAEDQQLLKDCATKAGIAVRENNDSWETKMTEEMTNDGMTIIDQVDTAAFQEKASSCYHDADLCAYIGEEYVSELLSIVGID